MATMTTSILVLAAGSLGDSILTLPALQYLQTKAPVTVAGTGPYQTLGASLSGVEEMVPLEPLLGSLYRSEPDQKLGRFSEVFVFFKEPDAKLEKALLTFTNLKIHWPSKKFEDFLKEERWVGHYWLDLVGLKDVSPVPRLLIPDHLKEKGLLLCAGLGLTQPFILHPGSGSPSKNAPLSFFRKAAEKTTAETSRQVLVLWGEAETSWVGEIRKTFEGIPRVLVLPELLTLPDLVGVLSQACGYLGNDSGVTQLASACGVKTFAVFNTTDPRLWGPQEAIILAAMQNLYRPA
jgi:ADP-heptose:LPS heptosyltransferase